MTISHHIRRRLLAVVISTFVLAALFVGTGLAAFFQADTAYSAALAEVSTVQDTSSELNNSLISEILFIRSFLITGAPSAITNRALAHDEFERRYAQLLRENVDHMGVRSETLARVADLHAKYDQLADEIIALRRAGAAEKAVQVFDDRSEPLVSALRAAREEMREEVQAAVEQTNRNYSERNRQIIGFLALAFVTAVAVSSVLILRAPESALHSLDFFERAMTQTAHSTNSAPIRLPRMNIEERSQLFEAYNTLISRLEEKDAQRMDFLAAIAHEMRWPLTSILGYASLLAGDSAPGPNSDSARFCEIIVRQAQRMGQLVEDVLTAAKIEEDQLPMILSPVRLGPLLAEVVEEARARSGRQVTYDDSLGAALMLGDPLRLREVYVNLIENALKYSASATPVHVSLRSAAARGWAEVVVQDYGVGIAESEMPILFRRFGRIHNERTNHIHGTGLGLYIVKHVVEKHKGHVAVASQPGRGSTFVVQLPLQEGRADGD